MLSTMMDRPLLVRDLLVRAERTWARKGIVSYDARGVHRHTYAELGRRVRRLADTLLRMGVRPGDRVASLAWNGHRHLELYFAVPSIGAVLHTLNPRISTDALTYVIERGGAQTLFADHSLLPVWRAVSDRVRMGRVVAMDDGDGIEPSTVATDAYESLIEDGDPETELPELDERSACVLCYTSGTTGRPKGVAYSHRSNVLHALAIGLPDCLGLTNADTALAIGPMFHVNGYGIPFGAPTFGADLVLPGRHVDPESLTRMVGAEGVTVAGAVPSVTGAWLDYLGDDPDRRAQLTTLSTVLVGGSAVPRAQLERFHELGVFMLHGWGMTETSPIGTSGRVKAHLPQDPGEAHWSLRESQGYSAPLVEVALRGEQGEELPWDGTAVGELVVRGPWITAGYVGDATASAEALTDDGWFRTGDIATIDSEGYVRIRDRAKDVIKSGGEWVSSVTIETLLMDHPSVQEAAVVAMHHPRWMERPLAVVVLRPDADAVTAEELNGYLLTRSLARWQLPDHYEFQRALPKTAVGKFDKRRLRAALRASGLQVLGG